MHPMENFIKIGEKIPKKEKWNQIIIRWCQLMDKAIERCNIERPEKGQKELPYWYDEGTNVGFLTGAIWLEGGIVFEQLGIDKSFEGNKGKGRGDFLFEIDNFRCYVEAKREKPTSSTGKIIENITAKLNEAKIQLERIQNRNNIGMTICFVIPELRSLDDVDALNSTNDIFDKIKKHFTGDTNIITTYMPRGDVHIECEGYYYPGVAIVGALIS
jgi:hypothetical protein